MIDTIGLIKGRIAAAAIRAGGDPSGIVLVAVTKTFSVEAITQALTFGITDIGESKIQEAQAKFPLLPQAGITRHLIGHLQTNKAKKAVVLFDLIQSLDSERLADAINAQARARDKVQDCLVEIKVSPEESKTGLAPAALHAFLAYCAALQHIRVRGLMTVAPYGDTPEQARPYFREAKSVFDAARAAYPQLQILSMGMSDDFEVAIEEGATMVRIGSAIFGERDYGKTKTG